MVDDAFPPFYQAQKTRVNQSLESLLPDGGTNRLAEAMRYTVLGGGKRIRGILLLEAFRLGPDDHTSFAERLSGVVELLHTYTLVHDDLPAMDDDDIRRGQPACHQQFDEATAILCGNALQSLAYRSLARVNDPDNNTKTLLINRIGDIFGYNGVLDGQVRDLDLEGAQPPRETILEMYEKKTGYLFGLSLELGAVSGGLAPKTRKRLRRIGRKLGVAFQIRDDLLERKVGSDQLGKNSGSDRKEKKSTLAKRIGEEAARTKAEEYLKQGNRSLQALSFNTSRLKALADFIVERTY